LEEKLEKKIKETDVLDSIKSREIVQEILNFGVNDFQVRKIIKLLALELEDRETMINICNALDEEFDQKPKIEI
jgi:hypothetical protein